jgi:hypothetical protein
MIDLTKSLRYLCPEGKWSLNGDTYDGLTWLSDTPKPTEQELVDAYPLAVAEIEARKAAQLEDRAAAVAHAKSLGFTDEMIAGMWPGLGGAL